MNPVLPVSALGPPSLESGHKARHPLGSPHGNPRGNYRPGIAPGPVRPESCNPYAESGLESACDALSLIIWVIASKGRGIIHHNNDARALVTELVLWLLQL